MKKRFRLIIHIIAAFLIPLLIVACGKAPDHSGLYQEIKSVDKLVLANMAVSKTAVFEDDEWYKIGKRIAAYSYDSYLRAYIDLSSLQREDIKFDEEARTVEITLPPVKTEVVGRDMELRKEYDNIGMFRSKIDSKERAEIKEKANRSFTKEVAENPRFKEQLTEAAKRKARKYFETLLEAEGYTAVVDFKE